MKPSEQIKAVVDQLVDLSEKEDAENSTTKFFQQISGTTTADMREARRKEPGYWIAAILAYLDQKDGQ